MAAGCADLRLARAIREHRAWLSVDVLSPREAGENAYLVIGKLLAELADEDCLAIVAPALQQMSPWEPALAATLRGTQPLDAVRVMSQVPVTEVSGDDPLMVAAVAEARGRWPEFVAAFEVRRPEQNFAVKAPFREGEFREFLWLGVTAIEHDTICGKIDNDPVELKQVQSGSRVQVAVPEINDWVYTDGDNLQGGFTIEALRKAAQRKTK